MNNTSIVFELGLKSNASLVNYAEASFGIADYIVFALFLCVSGCVGIFFSWRSKNTTGEYFLGNRQMETVPLGLSGGVSFISALSLVGYPAEMYVNGYDFLSSALLFGVVYAVFGSFIAHILHSLGVSSISQYLELRFHSRIVNYIANTMMLLSIINYMGSCMLGSVIAFTSMTGGQVSIPLGLTIAGAVGIFYTSIGGIKAVVWTDVIQAGVMVIGVVAVIIQTVIDTDGGIARIIAENVKHNRIHHLSWSLDPTVRHTGWSLMFGSLFFYMSFVPQPAAVQRFCAAKSRKDAYLVATIAGSIMIFCAAITCLAGINLFGYYASRGCDVYAAKWIKKNEIIAYYVRERLSLPGFQGLFLAALFSASLSSLSSGLNTATMLIWEDILKPIFRIEMTERKSTITAEIIVIVLGVVGMIWCYCLHSFGGFIVQLLALTSAATNGSYTFMFLLSVFFVYYNSKSAIASLVCGFTLTLWLGFGSVFRGKPTVVEVLRTTIDNCAMNLTKTTSIPTPDNGTCVQMPKKSVIDSFYSLSYLWATFFCFLVSLVAGLLITACTKSQEESLNPLKFFNFHWPRLRICQGKVEENCASGLEEKKIPKETPEV